MGPEKLVRYSILAGDAVLDRLPEVVEEALGAGLIEELPEPVGRYQFTHALIQETLIEEISITRRVRLHARISEALELLYGAEAETHAAELAHHFSQAEASVRRSCNLMASSMALSVTYRGDRERCDAHRLGGISHRGVVLKRTAQIGEHSF